MVDGLMAVSGGVVNNRCTECAWLDLVAAIKRPDNVVDPAPVGFEWHPRVTGVAFGITGRVSGVI